MSKITMMAIAVTCLLCAGSSKESMAQDESYTAILATSNASAKQIPFNFTITKWATDDEIKQLGKVLKEQGQDALVAELKKLDAGRINAVGQTGNQIAVAEKSTSGSDTIITLINARNMSVSEQQRKATHTNYPFGFLQVKVNEKGEGTGKMVTAAKIKYDDSKGHAVLDPYGNGSNPVTNVRPLK
jgi:hypothetical protein